MLAMSRATADLALLGDDRSKPWNSYLFEKASFAVSVQPYIPERPYRPTKLYTWSRFILGPATQKQQELIPLASFTLAATTPNLHVGSDSSLCGSEDVDSWCKSGSAKPAYDSPEPLVFNIHFEGQIHVRLLEFSTFAQWESVEVLLEGFENEGAVIEQLWDVREKMAIWRGDWDARVCPGLEIDVICSRPDLWEDDWDSSSESEGDEEEEEEEEEEDDAARTWDGVHLGGRRWWFSRWRMKVEQEAMGAGGAVRQPSGKMLLVGALAMATFLGVVVVLCIV
jgi:hypothetical protein